MGEGYETFPLEWAELMIEVSYRAHWLNSELWHIELRCTERLPVTATGYRSHFVPMAEIPDPGFIRKFVLGWLDEAARQPEWQAHLEDSRQLTLF